MAQVNSTGGSIFDILPSREALLQEFFHVLWQRGRTTKACNEAAIPRIPDTVILHRSKPIQWYFTARDGSIRKKSRKRLSTPTILQSLASFKPRSTSGAVAELTSCSETCEDGVDAVPLTPSHLQTMLAEGAATGILQSFVDPKTDARACCNSDMVAHWTPNVLILEKRVNTLRLDDTRYTLEERTTLSETSRFVRVQPVVSAVLTKQVEAMCANFARHVHRVFGCRVTSSQLHARIDERNCMWLLYCSGIRICQDVPPRSVSLSLAANAAKEAPRARSCSSTTLAADDVSTQCALCHNAGPSQEMSFVPQKHILFVLSTVSFASQRPSNAQLRQEDCLGRASAFLHEELTEDQHSKLCKDSSWLDQRLPLCAACLSGLSGITESMAVNANGSLRVGSAKQPQSLPRVERPASSSVVAAPLAQRPPRESKLAQHSRLNVRQMAELCRPHGDSINQPRRAASAVPSSKCQDW